VLDAMERREAAEARRSELATEQASVAEQAAGLTAKRDAALEEIGEQEAKAQAARTAVAADVPADVLALYDGSARSRGSARPCSAAAGAKAAISRCIPWT